MLMFNADELFERLGLTVNCENCKRHNKDYISKCDNSTWMEVCDILDYMTPIDAEPVVRCKDCKWYDPPHINHGGGKRTDVEDDSPLVPLSVGINVGGRCMNTLREYCCNHDREDPDDYERLVKFRNRMDYCSDGERKDDEH